MQAKLQPVRIPEGFPDYYPQQLWARTDIVVAKAVEKHPTQAELLPLARFVVAGLTPDFCRELRSDLRRLRMGDLVRWLVTPNCRDYKEQQRLLGEVRKSKEWLALAKASVETTAVPQPAVVQPPQPSSEPATAQQPVDAESQPQTIEQQAETPEALTVPEVSRRERVKQFLDHVLHRKYTRKQFAAVAGIDPADLRRWQRNDPKTSATTDFRVEATLKLTQDEFINEWNICKKQ